MAPEPHQRDGFRHTCALCPRAGGLDRCRRAASLRPIPPHPHPQRRPPPGTGRPQRRRLRRPDPVPDERHALGRAFRPGAGAQLCDPEARPGAGVVGPGLPARG
ncbi:MAG: hypothetical protein EOO24_14900 [Comamonadaceae bacterium]|nr:MAG: hypothetical protein EOO24_14900 [Comamonadaceae bacterium]